jgi:positive regulator of sigma E activity
MIAETGTVIDKKGRAYRIKLKRTESCEGCHACLFSSDKTYMIAEAYSDFKVKNGDKVAVERIKTSKTKAGFFMFILPLIFFLIGFNLSNFIIKNLTISILSSDITDLINIASGIFFFSLPLIMLKLLSRHNTFQMKITKIL